MHRKKIGTAFIVVMLFLLFMPNSEVKSAEEDTVTITVTVKNFAVGLYEADQTTPYTTWAIGAVDKGSETVMSDADCIYVKNESNVACDFQLKLVEPANLTVSDTSPGTDVFVLMGTFWSSNSASPSADDFTEANDHINTSYITATTTVFAGDTDGANVPANSGVFLYLDFLAPTDLSDSHPQQTITLYVKAVNPS